MTSLHPHQTSLARAAYTPLVAIGLLVTAVRSDEVVEGQGDSVAFSQQDLEFFERKIRPLLIEHCYECHSAEAKTLQGGLRLDGRQFVLQGGDSGPAIEPGQATGGTLLDAIRYATFEMPPTGQLPAHKIALLEEWVGRGAPMPAGEPRTAAPAAIDFKTGREFWSFQPLRTTPVPAASFNGEQKTPIDAYVVARLNQERLKPSPPADRRTLIRRAYFDLIGLPPTPEEVSEFVLDDAPDAYARLIDRLLASPHYGERWARHWLDLSRYSDATASWLNSLAQAWHYRDWVVRAFNEDLPYDDFVRLQLAADHLSDSKPSDMAALGFLGLSPAYWKELKLDKEIIKGTVAEEWEERIDAIGRTFLGLTIACARCHDHKFDPISTADYYALAGVIASTRLIDRPIIPDSAYSVVQEARKEIASLEARIEQLKTAKPISSEETTRITDLERRITEIERTTPHVDSALAHAVDDAALYVESDGPNATKLTYSPGEALDLHIQIRGNPSNLGAVVPRRFLTVLSDDPPKQFTIGSGRGELAEAIVSEAGPLTARVIVNRLWAHHFGRGLVETTSDFGTQGALPSHPELLDYLARRLMESGWSLKAIHREIMLSATYQQSSAAPDDIPSGTNDPLFYDPDNRLSWRMSLRRLEIEVWRDAVLAVSGALDPRMCGPAGNLKDIENRRRTLYGRVDRYELDEMLRLFDFPDPLGHSPFRQPTTTPLQQLFVFNSPFIQRQSEQLALRLDQEHPGDRLAKIERAYGLLFSRSPTAEELRLGLKFLAEQTATDVSNAWPLYCQVLLGSNEFLIVD